MGSLWHSCNFQFCNQRIHSCNLPFCRFAVFGGALRAASRTLVLGLGRENPWRHSPERLDH
jgi:hypothetical protein